MNNNVSRLIFDAAISKAFDNIEMVRPSMEHYFSGGNINGNFREALLKLMNWVEKKTIEAANEAIEAARKDESEKMADEHLVKIMKEEPIKVIMWVLAKLGMEMQEANVGTMDLSQEVTLDGVKYRVAANVTKKEICE